jgi:hypothetical protein
MTATTWNDTLELVHGLFPHWDPTPEEAELFRAEYRDRNQAWLKEAMRRNRRDSRFREPKFPEIEAAWREVVREKSDAGEVRTAHRPAEIVHERHEAACVWMREWIDRTVPPDMLDGWAKRNAWRFPRRLIPTDLAAWEYQQLSDAVFELRRDLEALA